MGIVFNKFRQLHLNTKLYFGCCINNLVLSCLSKLYHFGKIKVHFGRINVWELERVLCLHTGRPGNVCCCVVNVNLAYPLIWLSEL